MQLCCRLINGIRTGICIQNNLDFILIGLQVTAVRNVASQVVSSMRSKAGTQQPGNNEQPK